MIDTDKYEGHLAHLEYELWAFTDFMNINATHEERCATDALLNDAPLLLAEVKWLREQLAKANKYVHTICQHSDSMLMDYEDYMKGDEEE